MSRADPSATSASPAERVNDGLGAAAELNQPVEFSGPAGRGSDHQHQALAGAVTDHQSAIGDAIGRAQRLKSQVVGSACASMRSSWVNVGVVQ